MGIVLLAVTGLVYLGYPTAIICYYTGILPLSYRYLIVIVSLSHRCIIGILPSSYQYPTVILWISYRYHTVILPLSYRYLVVILWLSYGYPMVSHPDIIVVLVACICIHSRFP